MDHHGWGCRLRRGSDEIPTKKRASVFREIPALKFPPGDTARRPQGVRRPHEYRRKDPSGMVSLHVETAFHILLSLTSKTLPSGLYTGLSVPPVEFRQFLLVKLFQRQTLSDSVAHLNLPAGLDLVPKNPVSISTLDDDHWGNTPRR